MSSIETDTAGSAQTSRNHQVAMTGDSSLPESYHLDGGGNFAIWAFRMKGLLQKLGRFHYCTTAPSEIMGDEEKIARQLVMSIISSNAKNSALPLLRRYEDPYECWTGLKAHYESDSGPRRVMLLERFFALRKTEAISMDTYLTEVRNVANLLEEVEVNMPEDVVVYYTLKNLPKEYEIFKRMQIAAQTLPKFNQLETKLISEETALKMEARQQEEGEALFLHRNTGRRPQQNARQGQSTAPYRFQRRQPDIGGPSAYKPPNAAAPGGFSTPRYQNSNYSFDQSNRDSTGTYQPRFRARGPERPRSNQCNFCREEGHFERECDLKAILDKVKDYEHRRRHRSLNGQAHSIEEPKEDFQQETEKPLADQVIDACLLELNMLEAPQRNSSWYLDSGATHHVSGDPNVFSSIQPISGSQIRSAGGQSHNVTGVGNVDIHVPSGEIKTFSSVLYTPGITKNLLSVGSLTDLHKTLVFKATGCFVIGNTNSQVEAFAHRENGRGLYRLQGDSLKPEVNSLHFRSQAALWHKRLGHFHERGLQRMISSNAVTGLPQFRTPKQICTGCQLGKHARTKLPKEATFRASRILELVHSDICGPFKTCSIGGAKYFITFIDDFSKKVWIYFITLKSQALEKFKHFVRLTENSTGQTVCNLRTDNGGEYTSRAFAEFCSSKGIKHELTPPYTPQRNGVAERKNRSLLDITRCLLLEKALPGHLWAEAVKAAGDILNLRSTKQHPDKTPNELFSGKKPSISHLRVFGSPVFTHISKAGRTKLEPRSEQCILLSFDDNVKAYRCYRPSTQKVFVSRDVRIEEETSPNSIQNTDHSETLQDPFISAPTRKEESRLIPSTPNPAQGSDTHPTPIPLPAPENSSPVTETPLSNASPTPTSQQRSDPPPLDDSPPDYIDMPPISGLSEEQQLRPTPTAEHHLPRRSDRVRRFPRHLQDFAANVELEFTDTSPELLPELTFKQVHNDPRWQAAMKAEMDSIHTNNTWTLVPLPPHKNAISSKWVFKVKTNTNGQPPRYKARIVARGFEQQDGVDFGDTFAPVVRWETIRILIALATHLNWSIHQLDVLTAFLNGILTDEVYMYQPPGFIQRGTEHLVCKLHKSLYGLRQSPRAWYARLHAALLAWQLIQSQSDPNLYFAHIKNHTIALLVYVDDILITGSDPRLITQLKEHLQCTFQTNDLGIIHRYLGVQFEKDSTGLHMHQTEYALSILSLFNMDDCSPSFTPLPEGLVLSKDSRTPPVDAKLYRMLVGKLLFLTKTRPNIAHAVSVVVGSCNILKKLTYRQPSTFLGMYVATLTLACFTNKGGRITSTDILTPTTARTLMTEYPLVPTFSSLENHLFLGIPRNSLAPRVPHASQNIEPLRGARAKLCGFEDCSVSSRY